MMRLMPESPPTTRPQVAHAALLLGRKTAAATFLVGVAASISVFILLHQAALRDSDRALANRAHQVTRALEAKVALPVQALEAVVAYRRALPPERKLFQLFASSLLVRHPSLAALEYAEVVPADQRLAVEARMSADAGRPIRVREPDASGRMVPSPERARYTVLTSIEPWNDEVIGLDVGFEQERRLSLERAAEAGERWCSSRVRLVEDPVDVYSVVVYEPEYAGGLVPSDPLERRRSVRGYAIALFRLEPLMKQALAGLDTEGIDVTVLDKTELDRAGPGGDEATALLFRDGAALGERAAMPSVTRELTFAGRTWVVRIAGAIDPASGTAWVALALGIGLSLFVAVALGALTETRRFRREMRAIRRLGQYEIIRLVAVGGMGRVYEARHALLKRRTALKVVSPDFASEDTLASFEREVRATSLLTHPNTVVVYDFGRSEHGHFYYAMEFIDGPSFDELVRLEGRLAPERVRHLLLQVAGALAEAHGQGFVHRDVKPANLMCTVRGGRFDCAKVLDFGLVRDMHGSEQRLTSTGSVSGTPGFLPPEVFGARVGGGIGPAVDVYAIGCVAYLLLTGHEVFESTNPAEVVGAHLAIVPVAPSLSYGIDPRFDALVLRCIAKDPAERFANGAVLYDALDALPIGPWSQGDAEASWRRWETARATRAPDQAQNYVPDISHIDVALGPARSDDLRAYLPTQAGTLRGS